MSSAKYEEEKWYRFRYDNLPITSGENHGIGLLLVKNTVERYIGKMLAYVENGQFKVNIIMYGKI